MNLNVVMNVPVMSKSGAFAFNFGMVGNFYVSEQYNASQRVYQWYPSNNGNASGLPTLYGEANGVLSYWGGPGVGYQTTYAVDCPSPNQNTQTTKYSNFYIAFDDQTIHALPTKDFIDSVGCFNKTFTDQVLDGTGYTMTAVMGTAGPQTTVYHKSGTTYPSSSSGDSVTDSNSNSITWTSSKTYTDTLGLTALTVGGSGVWTQTPTFTWTDVNDGSQQASVTGTTYTLQSAFGCSGISDYDLPSQSLPTKIGFPDGTNLQLAYEQTPNSGNVTGRPSKITLRSGGTVTYNWNPNNAANDGFNCTYSTPNSLTRTTTDGKTTYTLSYNAVSGDINTYNAVDTVVDAGGNQTVYTFGGFTSTGPVSGNAAPVLNEVQKYQGTTTLLTTDVYCYDMPFSECTPTPSGGGAILPVTEVVVFHQINGMGNWSATDTKYDNYGNVTYTAQYDFGGASPVRTTTIQYGTCTANCSGLNPTMTSVSSTINNKPGSIVTTTNGVNVAASNYTYDSHGNLLTTYVWTGSAWLSNGTPNSYNSNGTNRYFL